MAQQIKKLNPDALTKLQALESELGCCIVAYETQSRFANLSEVQLQRLQTLEKEANAVLLAYECW